MVAVGTVAVTVATRFPFIAAMDTAAPRFTTVPAIGIPHPASAVITTTITMAIPVAVITAVAIVAVCGFRPPVSDFTSVNRI